MKKITIVWMLFDRKLLSSFSMSALLVQWFSLWWKRLKEL